MAQRLDVMQFTDYRAYLKARIEEAQATNPKVSVRSLAPRMGFRSTGTLSKVLSGKGNLSTESALMVAEWAGLKGRAAEYFLSLVGFDQAHTHEERTKAFAKLCRFEKSKAVQHTASLLRLYAKWHHVVIRELLYFHPFRGDGGELGNRLEPAIGAEAALESIALLQELGLVRQTPKGLVRADAVSSTTGPHVQSLAVDMFQLAMMEQATRAVQQIPREKRNISTLTFSLSSKDFHKLEEEVRDFRKRILQLASDSTGEDVVYQCNLQLFPVTRCPT